LEILSSVGRTTRDEVSAAIVFATLNTTRARLELVQRLAKAKIKDRETAKTLERVIDRFNDYTRIRNEFNHCMYTLSDRGEITHTHAMRIRESKGRLVLGEIRAIDESRLSEMVKTINDLKKLNRELWDFLPRLQASVVPPQTSHPKS
jgi:formylmethanofuran dehydrogenase subunit A